MLPEYNQTDYRKACEDVNPTSREGDSGFKLSYFGRSAHPYESVFIKTTRSTFSNDDLMRFAFSMSIYRKLSDCLAQQAFVRTYTNKIQASSLRLTVESKLYRRNLLKSFFKKI